MSSIKLNKQHQRKDQYSSQSQEPPPQPTSTEKRFLKALHWMRCPKCGLPLTTERHGSVEFDLCPACHGLWLDAPGLQALLAAENESLRSVLRNHCLQ